MSQEEFKQGDEVERNTRRGKTCGTVKKKLTSRTEVGGQRIAASEYDPRYLVERRPAKRQPTSLTR